MTSRADALFRVIVAVGLVALVPAVGHSQPAPNAEEPSQDLGDLESLLGEEVVTTASRSAERSTTAPATVQIIDGATLRRYGMRSLDEALGFLGLGSFVADSSGDSVSGVDTGFQGVLLRDRGRHVLVLIDGHVANWQSGGEIRLDVGLGIPLELIDHVEVMLGPGSVSYGSNAMMAVVNVVMLRARDYGTARLVAEGTLVAPIGINSSLSFGGDGDRYGGRYRLGGGFARSGTLWGRPAEIVLHGEWQQEVGATFRMALQEGYDIRPGEPGWGGIGRQRMRTPMAYLSARLGDARLWVQGSSYERNLPLLGTFNEPSTNERFTTLRGELRHDADLTPEVSLVSRLYADYLRHEENSRWVEYYYCLPGQQLDGCRFRRRTASISVGVEEQLNIDWKLDGRFVTTMGGDLRVRDVSARPADYADFVTGAPPATVRQPYWASISVIGAVFAQQVLRVHDRVTLNVGARFDGDSLFGVRLSPRAAIIVSPTDQSTIRLGYSEAFRAPSASELNDLDPTYYIPPESLNAETVRTADLEVAQRFSRGSFAVRAFASIYGDLIVRADATPEQIAAAVARQQLAPDAADTVAVETWVNSDVIRAAGATVTARSEPTEGLDLAANLTLAINDLDGVGRLPIIPAFYGNARIAYQFGDAGPTLGLVGRFSSARAISIYFDEDFVPPGTTAGALGELRLTASGPFRAVPGLRWNAFVNASLSQRQPYLISAGPTDYGPNNTTAFQPNHRLFAFVGVHYDLP